jgi:hypothetical protein
MVDGALHILGFLEDSLVTSIARGLNLINLIRGKGRDEKYPTEILNPCSTSAFA